MRRKLGDLPPACQALLCPSAHGQPPAMRRIVARMARARPRLCVCCLMRDACTVRLATAVVLVLAPHAHALVPSSQRRARDVGPHHRALQGLRLLRAAHAGRRAARDRHHAWPGGPRASACPGEMSSTAGAAVLLLLQVAAAMQARGQHCCLALTDALASATQMVGSRRIRCGWAQHKQDEMSALTDPTAIDM